MNVKNNITIKQFKKYFKHNEKLFVGFRDGFSSGYLKGFNEEGFFLSQLSNAKPLLYSWDHFEVVVQNGIRIYPERHIPSDAVKMFILPPITDIYEIIEQANEQLRNELKSSIPHKYKPYLKKIIGIGKPANPIITDKIQEFKIVETNCGIEYYENSKLFFNYDLYTEDYTVRSLCDMGGNSIKFCTFPNKKNIKVQSDILDYTVKRREQIEPKTLYAYESKVMTSKNLHNLNYKSYRAIIKDWETYMYITNDPYIIGGNI